MVAGDEAGRGPLACEQRAHGEAVREALRQRDEIGLDPELLVGEERARAADARLHLVDAEQRPDLARELGRRLREVGLERDHPALAEHGLEQHQRRVAAGASAASSDSTSFGRANETPGTSGPKPSHFAGCPVAESAPSVLPWKPPSSATILVRPVALRAILSAASLASAPGVAEERPAALEPLREQPGQPQHRLGPVEVRRVPEPVELLPGGGERRRRAVAETDDRDPGDEVEVLAAGVVPDPAALAAHDRDVGARIGREHAVRAAPTTLVTEPLALITPPPPSRR